MDAAAPSPAKIEPRLWRLAGVLVLGLVMTVLDTTIINVALDTLVRDLDTTIAKAQWVVTAYMLALAAAMPLTGWFARRFGAKRVYIGSVIVFTVGSALCGLATSSTSLILFRVLQGLGGGMILPVAQMILGQVAGPSRVGRMMSFLVMPAMVAPILGPTLGGVILEGLHWSWIFFVNVPVGIIGIVLAVRTLPRDTDLGAPGRLDTVGLVLLVTSMPLVVFGVSEVAARDSFTAATVLCPIVAGLVLLAVFCVHALRTTRPLLDIRLYANRIFAAAGLTTFGLGVAMFGSLILLPLYYQQVRDESVIMTGILIAPHGIGALLAAPFSGRLTDRIGGGRVSFIGVAILAGATVPLIFIGDDTSILLLLLLMAARGVGIAFSYLPTTAAAFAALRSDQLSDAAPQLNVLLRLGAAVGAAVLAVVLQRASEGATSSAELADAFGTAYWWAFGITAATLVPCSVLFFAQRANRSPSPAEAAEAALESATA